MTSDSNHFLNVAPDILHLTAWFGVYVRLGEANFYVSCPLFSSLIYTESSFYSSENFPIISTTILVNASQTLTEKTMLPSRIRDGWLSRTIGRPSASFIVFTSPRTSFDPQPPHGKAVAGGAIRATNISMFWFGCMRMCCVHRFARTHVCTYAHMHFFPLPPHFHLQPPHKQQAGRKRKGAALTDFRSLFPYLLERKPRSWCST